MALFDDLRRRLAAQGMNVVFPLTQAAFDAACAEVVPLRADDLLPGARSVVVVGSGGRTFFDRFLDSGGDDGAPDPLDRYTRKTVARTVGEALSSAGPVRHRVFFPFVDVAAAPVIPFQRLGRAAGLGGPGPLALQIHPRFGPWWAYRALIALDVELPVAPPLGDGCAGCDAPCVDACPAHAVQRSGFLIGACHTRRLESAACASSCDARIRCVRGPEFRYTERQLAFFMRASMPRRRPSSP